MLFTEIENTEREPDEEGVAQIIYFFYFDIRDASMIMHKCITKISCILQTHAKTKFDSTNKIMIT